MSDKQTTPQNVHMEAWCPHCHHWQLTSYMEIRNNTYYLICVHCKQEFEFAYVRIIPNQEADE